MYHMFTVIAAAVYSQFYMLVCACTTLFWIMAALDIKAIKRITDLCCALINYVLCIMYIYMDICKIPYYIAFVYQPCYLYVCIVQTYECIKFFHKYFYKSLQSIISQNGVNQHGRCTHVISSHRGPVMKYINIMNTETSGHN